MQDKHLFEYAVIRFVPRVEREEFLNVGVIVYCPAQHFLEVAFSLNEERLQAFTADLDIKELEQHLTAFEQICKGGPKAGVIGKLSMSSRFRWLTATRSTTLQTSPVHLGLTANPEETINRLYDHLVL